MPSYTVYNQQARLERERRKQEEKFGWDDLFDLLQTVAGGYSAIKGVQNASARTDLMAAQQAANLQTDTMDTMSEGRVGTWDRAPDDYVGPAPAGEIPGPQGRMQFSEQTPEPHEWSDPRMGDFYDTNPAGKALLKPKPLWPEDAQATGQWPDAPDVLGQVHTWTDPESGRPFYTRSHLPDAQGGPGQMIDIPGTDYQMDINTSQGRQMVLEMWRAENVGKNPFEAAEGRFKTLYGNYPDPEMDAQAEMLLLSAEIGVQHALSALAPPDLFIDVLITGNDVAALDQMGLRWLDEGVDTATIEALQSYVQVLKKRAGTGR